LAGGAILMSQSYLKFASPLIDEGTVAGVAEVLRSGQIASGPWVQKFEGELSRFCGGRPVRALTSATAAVEVALQLCGIGPGDEVITSAQSFFTVLNMIVKVGAEPVFVDCDLVTRNIDLGQVEAAVTPRTKAIIPTHYPGALVDLDALYALAQRLGLRVIEDAALVLGSRWKGRNVGAIGDLVSFSFHPNKNITSIEGGALVVNDEAEAKKVEALRFHGISYLPDRTREVAFAGGKFNLPDVNARIGCAQLERLPEFLARRRALVDRYFARFETDPACVLPPRPSEGDGQSWNMFCVLLPLPRMTITRKGFRDAMESRGIGTGVSYEALNLCTLGRRHGGREGQCANAERIARDTVTLPLHVAMTEADVDRVCAAAAEVIGAARK
jgi:dTDP-4-amino-4,6-dideoxygalactose transaminase